MGHITYPQFPDSPGHPNVTYSESEAFYTIDHSVPGTTGYYRRCHVFHWITCLMFVNINNIYDVANIVT